MYMNNFLFDLDGVLIDSENAYTEFWETVQNKFVTDVPDFCERIKGNTIEYILEHYIDSENRDEVRNSFFQFEKEFLYTLYPKALEVIKQIHNQGRKIAIVTSSDDVKMSALRDQIPDLFTSVDYILTANEMRRSKPAPDCWWQAAEKLGVDVKDCVILEDSINGLKSAHASGGYVIGVATSLPFEVVSQYSNKVIKEIGELYE